MTVAPLSAYPPAPNPQSGDTRPDEDVRFDPRYLTRTPSPTPSEADVLSGKKKRSGILALLDVETYKNPRELIRLLITLAIIALVVLFFIYQQKIVDWLKPFANWMRSTPGGWLIPIAILIVMSFPPLFGHEIIAILCGDVWGPGIGFGIVAAGTVFGELANYYVFKWFCMARGKKLEEKKLQYALIAEVVREGGFLMAVIIRFSAIPGHFTTAIFATCGMDVLTFLAAAILSLPKQFATVYLGSAQSNGNVDRKTKTIKTVVIVITVVVTMFAMHYLRTQTEKVKDTVIYRRRKARQAKLRAAAGMDPLADPEAALDSVASPLLATHPGAGETFDLDGVRVHVPTPQPASSYGYAPEPAAPLSKPEWRPEDYTSPPAYPQQPEVGYNVHARSPSRSPQPETGSGVFGQGRSLGFGSR